MNRDDYFYLYECDGYGETTYSLYKEYFDTKEKVIKFLRQLENKQIIRNYGNQSMIISSLVWDILIKHADEIFTKDTKDDAEE